ncbi:MAG: hypothetical protein KJ626_00630 [Verrucomicrobia bacterium]|nr:hypothetical protein [Verrucomicrobiota bacterium]
MTVLCVFFLVITLFSLVVYAASEAAQRRAKNRADDLIANFLVSSLYDLEALHLDTVNSLLPIIQPGTNTMLHSTVPFVVPFDVDSMPEKFNDGLIGEWNDEETAVSYLIYIVMDEEGDLTFLNDTGAAIGDLDAADDYDPLWLVKLRYPDLENGSYTKAEIEYLTATLHANRIATQVLLVPSDSLYAYLLAEEEAASFAAALLGGGGGDR